MAAQAAESPSVADRACRLVELGVGTRVGFQKLRGMIGRPQFGIGPMALLATEGQLDLAVADQAIGHLRQVGTAHGVGRLDTAMAGEAEVRAVQLSTQVARLGKVLAAIDGFGDYGRDVPKLQVLFVAEMRQTRLGRWRNRHTLVTRLTCLRRWQIVVFDARTVRHRGMAACAVRLQFQMDAMREGRG